MEFKSRDKRALAEKGFVYQLLDADTREPLFDGDTPIVFNLRGAASPTAQKLLSDVFASGKKETDGAAKPDVNDPEAYKKQGFEGVHWLNIRTAMCYIISAGEKVDWGEGNPVGSDSDLIANVLNSEFPQYERSVDKDGEPKLELVNYPYANQIIDAAEAYGRFLGKKPTA